MSDPLLSSEVRSLDLANLESKMHPKSWPDPLSVWLHGDGEKSPSLLASR